MPVGPEPGLGGGFAGLSKEHKPLTMFGALCCYVGEEEKRDAVCLELLVRFWQKLTETPNMVQAHLQNQSRSVGLLG